MILILDNLVNNYLNILSCFIILSIFNLNKEKYFLIFIIDILFNRIPFISIIIFLLFYLNRFLFKIFVSNNLNKFILSCFYMIIFLSFIYLLNDYNYSYLYYLKINLFSLLFNILIYYIYFFYKDNSVLTK